MFYSSDSFPGFCEWQLLFYCSFHFELLAPLLSVVNNLTEWSLCSSRRVVWHIFFPCGEKEGVAKRVGGILQPFSLRSGGADVTTGEPC